MLIIHSIHINRTAPQHRACVVSACLLEGFRMHLRPESNRFQPQQRLLPVVVNILVVVAVVVYNVPIKLRPRLINESGTGGHVRGIARARICAIRCAHA